MQEHWIGRQNSATREIHGPVSYDVRGVEVEVEGGCTLRAGESRCVPIECKISGRN